MEFRTLLCHYGSGSLTKPWPNCNITVFTGHRWRLRQWWLVVPCLHFQVDLFLKVVPSTTCQQGSTYRFACQSAHSNFAFLVWAFYLIIMSKICYCLSHVMQAISITYYCCENGYAEKSQTNLLTLFTDAFEGNNFCSAISPLWHDWLWGKASVFTNTSPLEGNQSLLPSSVWAFINTKMLWVIFNPISKCQRSVSIGINFCLLMREDQKGKGERELIHDGRLNVVIPKEAWVCMTAPTLLLVWHQNRRSLNFLPSAGTYMYHR